MMTPLLYCRVRQCLVCMALVLVSTATSRAQQNGVVLKTDKASPGYTLIAPLGSTSSFLIDLDGNVVHTWPSDYRPGQSVYLLDDGSLLRSAKVMDNRVFPAGGGSGGRVQRIAWDGELLWDFVYSDDTHAQHHDIEPMPNGNVLLAAFDYKSRDEAIAAGRDPEKLTEDALWPDTVVEIQPVGKTRGEIVWKWSVWDHLVQSHDRSKPNYGRPSDHPELVDLNFMRRGNPDWIHMNSVNYNANLDQIVMSARWFNEIWIVDHSTTTEEAAGHTGGRCGKGGDLLYRWGNPFTYFAGLPNDRQLYAQHDARWIPDGHPGAGNITVFNNGEERGGDRTFSSVDEIVPPLLPSGNYALSSSAAYGPERIHWSYVDDPEFFSPRISGAERQPNGNTLICSGTQGRIFEVDPDGNVVWDYHNPLGTRPGGTEGDRPRGRGQRGARPDNAGPQPGPPDPGARGGPEGGSSSTVGASVFRAPRYAPDHPAFKGKNLKQS